MESESVRTAELQRQVRELSTLLEVSRVINRDLDPDRVLRTVLEQAMQVLEAEAGTLWSLEEKGTAILPMVAFGPAADAIRTIRIRPGQGIVGAVIQTGIGDLVADVRQDPRFANWVDRTTGFVTRSIVSAPLHGKTGTIGCLQLVNKSEGRYFSQSDLDLLTALGAQAALVIENSRLLEETRALSRSLQEAWTGSLDALTAAMATRDEDTHGHCQRTVELSILLARRLGVPEEEIPALARGALLHDVGKIGIPDSILFKPGRHTPEEREIMKRHVKLGHDMLVHIDFFRDAMPVVLYHHENYDGTGYVAGITGAEIPVGARIFHAVDVYDALTSERPYKKAWTHEEAVAELQRNAGTHFDPAVVEALARLAEEEIQLIRNLHGFPEETRLLLGAGIGR
jgi:putative nucleotidyltransferase with HDIG domain